MKTLDKIMPMMAATTNEAAGMRELATAEEAERVWALQRAELAASYGAEFPALLELHRDMAVEVAAIMRVTPSRP